jgi:hypothetical protein
MLNEQQFEMNTASPVEIQYATTFVACVQTGDMGPLYDVALVYKTKKTESGNKTKAEGRTLLARFGVSLGVKHERLDKYLDPKDKSSGFGPSEDGNLFEIASAIAMHIAGLTHVQNADGSLNEQAYVEALVYRLKAFGGTLEEEDEEEEPAPQAMTLSFGSAPSTPSPDHDPLAGLVPATGAMATETPPVDGVLLDSWADFEAVVPTLNATKADGDALIRAFFYTNQSSNGTVARVERNGLKWHDMKRMQTQLSWDNPIQNASLHIVSDVLRISPKRKVGDKMRGFFFQLTDTSEGVKTGNRLYVCSLLAAHLIRESGRNHYSNRMAPLVSQRFVDEATAKLGISTAKRDSAVVGGTAKSWNWKFESADWKTGGISVEDITADTFSLGNL